MLDKKLTLASLLCKPFQYSLIEPRILRHEASHPTDHGLTDAIFPGDFRVIFKSFYFSDYFKFNREVV
ncbi:unnamed protein product [Porites evermanni]|uniref:Uncharacterized protein n=1 Tax=Porites evermanni TaxID=104178 RepID=A0ABN8PBV1_9CNID|nr:unnamed protein product [Porites evermanni]